MTASAEKSRKQREAEKQLNKALEDSFPASDPPSVTVPAAEDIIPPGAGIPPRRREEKHLTDRSLSEDAKKKA